MKNPGPKRSINSKTKGTAKPTDVRAKQFVEQLKTYLSAEEIKKYHRYFKFDEASTLLN